MSGLWDPEISLSPLVSCQPWKWHYWSLSGLHYSEWTYFLTTIIDSTQTIFGTCQSLRNLYCTADTMLGDCMVTWRYKMKSEICHIASLHLLVKPFSCYFSHSRVLRNSMGVLWAVNDPIQQLVSRKGGGCIFKCGHTIRRLRYMTEPLCSKQQRVRINTNATYGKEAWNIMASLSIYSWYVSFLSSTLSTPIFTFRYLLYINSMSKQCAPVL